MTPPVAMAFPRILAGDFNMGAAADGQISVIFAGRRLLSCPRDGKKVCAKKLFS